MTVADRHRAPTAVRPPDVVRLDDVGPADASLVGEKAAELADLSQAGFPVPPGFVITSEAFRRATEAGGASQRLIERFAAVDPSDPERLEALARVAQGIVREAVIPPSVARQIRDQYEQLSATCGRLQSGATVAVRSTFLGLDETSASCAGMSASYTNVTGVSALLHRVVDCWVSAHGPRAVCYRASLGASAPPEVAVLVQEMVPSSRSGVAFSVDPTTLDARRVVIEAALGQGEVIAQGAVEPDTYVVDRATRAIVGRHIGRQDFKIVSGATGTDRRVQLDRHHGERAKLSPDEILEVASLVEAIEARRGSPQSIEFVIDRHEQIFIVQARPVITNRSVDVRAGDDRRPAPTPRPAPLLRGLAASRGRATGRVRVLHSAHEGRKLEDGEILVAPTTNPGWFATIRRAGALVTDRGGMASHSAVISRELGVPAVVGTFDATSTLHDGDVVTVDGSAGTVVRAGAAAAPAPRSRPMAAAR